MSKTKKRRRNDENLFSLLGVGERPQENESLDDLLAEMESGVTQSSGVANITTARGSINSDTKDLTNQRSIPLQPSSPHGKVQLWDFSRDVVVRRNKDEVLTWNNSLRTWIKKGKYDNSKGLLPNFDVELARHFQVEKLSRFLLKSASDLRMPTFERWLIDSKLGEQKRADPVIPLTNPNQDASRRLVRELSEKMDVTQAEEVVQSLCLQAATAVQELTVKTTRMAVECPLRKGDRIEIENRNDNMIAFLYKRKGWKKPYCIKLNTQHYDKLKTMYERVHGDIEKKAMHAFHLIVMCLLLRYSSLSGGQLLNDLRGGGMQGAIHPHAFRSLEGMFGTCFVELFASPLNAYYPQFNSVFPDFDWHFGSLGSVFGQNLEEGHYEANPPFSPGLMTKMASCMQKWIQQANDNSKALTFVVIVPSATQTTTSCAQEFAKPSFELLKKLSCQHILLKSREHGYVEGAQHLKPIRYKESPYDTCVLVLRSTTAAQLPVTFEEELRAAFSRKYEDELEGR